MNPFTYARPTELAGAVRELAADPTAKLIAGGTNLVDLMKYDVLRPTRLIDISRLPGLDQIAPEGEGLRIGALVRNAHLAIDSRVAHGYPLLASALLAGASPQLRNAATTGGNLLQRTRCYYFYDAVLPCNKRNPGSGCPAIGGVNRIHAILGASADCIATNPSDMNVAMAALEAEIAVSGPAGERRIAMADFHRLPGNAPQRDTTLHDDEIITGVVLPKPRFARHYTYLKLRDRASYAFALVSVAVGLEMDGGRIVAARIALGGVAHKPWRVPAAEQALAGKPFSAEASAEAATLLLEGAVAQSQNGFKIELAKRAIGRALRQAVDATPQHAADTSIA